MKVHFFDKHKGTGGAGVPLPLRAAQIAGRYEYTDGDPAEIVRELREAYPEGEVRDVPPARSFASEGELVGMIVLILPATGFPRSGWRVLKYRPAAEANR